MNFRTTAILFSTLLVLGIVLLVFSFTQDEGTPSRELLMTNLAGMKAAEVDTLELEKGSSRLVFKQQHENHWTLLQPITARGEASTVRNLNEALFKLKATAYPDL